MDKVQQIRAEIERRIESWSIREKHSPIGQGKDTCTSRVTELKDILSFIDSLPEEQFDYTNATIIQTDFAQKEEVVSDSFEKAFKSAVDAIYDQHCDTSIHEFAQKLWNIARRIDRISPKSPLISINEQPVNRPRATLALFQGDNATFRDWQRRNTNAAMAELEEKSKIFSENHKEETPNEIIAQMKGEEPASDDLEKEMYEHLWKGRIGTDISKPIYFSYDELLEVARHFSEWQNNQMKEALQTEYEKGRFDSMQDFLEKAEEFLYEQFNIHPHDCHVVQYVSDTPLEDIDDFVEQFKNYMQDE